MLKMQLEESQECAVYSRTPELEETQRLLRQAEHFLEGPVITYWDSDRGVMFPRKNGHGVKPIFSV